MLALAACLLVSPALVRFRRAKRRARAVARERAGDALVAERASELDLGERDLACRSVALVREEEAVEQGRRELANDKQRLEDDLVRRQAELDRREEAVSLRDRELGARESEHASRAANLARMEVAIGRRGEKLDQEAAEQAGRTHALAEEIASVEARAAHLATEEEVRLAELERREQELRTGEVRLARGRAVLDGRLSDRRARVARADELARAKHAPDRAPLRHVLELQPEASTESGAVGPFHLLFVPIREGYALVEREGSAPRAGTELQLPDGADERASHFVVAKVGRSPLPSDARDCAYLQRLAPRGNRDAEPAARDSLPSASATNAA
jgi:hypothetical protein